MAMRPYNPDHPLWTDRGFEFLLDNIEEPGVTSRVLNIVLCPWRYCHATRRDNALALRRGGIRAGSPPPLSATDHRIRGALQVMELEYGHHLTAKDLAQRLGLSRSRFEHLFTAETGTRFRPALRHIRLSKSQALLRNSNLSVKEIADRIGFRSGAAFSRAFEELYGEPPSQWRRRAAEVGDGTFR